MHVSNICEIIIISKSIIPIFLSFLFQVQETNSLFKMRLLFLEFLNKNKKIKAGFNATN